MKENLLDYIGYLKIFTHLGIGDHIICNGLLRYFCSKEDVETVTTFCTDKNKKNIEFMYRDEERIKILSFPARLESKEFNAFRSRQGEENLLIGFNFTENYRFKNELTFDETFYKQAGINFNVRFDNFYLERDPAKEENAFKQLTRDHKKYIYVHDDPSRGFIIDRNKINTNIPIVENSFDYNLFQMRKVIENATEIHTMQTGMFDFCNSIKLNCPIYVHLYVRKYTDFLLSKINKNNEYIFVY